MNNSVVRRGPTRCKIEYFKLQQQQYGYVGEFSENCSCVNSYRKKILDFIVICMLPSWVLESVRSQEASKTSLQM